MKILHNKDAFQMKGSVSVRLIGPDGAVKQSHEAKNLVVTVGKTYLASWLAASSQASKFMSYVGVGTSSTAAASGDTALGSELSGGGYARQQGALTSASNVWTNTVTFSPGVATGAVTEAGLFSVSTGGTLFAHQVFTAYNVKAADTLVVVWSLTFN